MDQRDNRMKRADAVQDAILENLGPEAAYNELCKAISTDARLDALEYIARMHDIDLDDADALDE